MTESKKNAVKKTPFSVKKDAPAVEKTESPSQKESIQISKRFMIGLVLAVAILAVGILSMNLANRNVAARVNGEEITLDELDRSYNSLPEQYKSVVTKEALLEQLVQTKVIYQEAVENDMAVSEEEARMQFEMAKAASGVNEEEFLAALAEQGLTEDALVDQYMKQLTIEKYLDEQLLSTIVISDEEVEEYYNEHPEEFDVPAQVTVRHILIGDTELTKVEQVNKAQKILKELTKENFCEKVTEHSTDTASVPTCGEYTFSMNDAFVPEFKTLSFSQPNGRMGIATTQFGAHIIWTVSKTPARTVSLEEAQEDIREGLQAQKGQEGYEAFYENLAADSKIEILYDAQ